jgi:RNA polymerase sigma-70 factor (ECF subfamily)
MLWSCVFSFSLEGQRRLGGDVRIYFSISRKLPNALSESAENLIRQRHGQGDHGGAAALAIEGYGAEVFGFLVASLRNEADAQDVYSQVCEDVIRGLPGFEWRSSFRTWLYRLARAAMARHLRTPARRAGRRVPLSQISEPEARARTETLPFLRTEAKDSLARVRDALEPADRMLLVLRIDRRLAWSEIVAILGEGELEGDPLEREAARLRKRFQALKEKIAAQLKEESQ